MTENAPVLAIGGVMSFIYSFTALILTIAAAEVPARGHNRQRYALRLKPGWRQQTAPVRDALSTIENVVCTLCRVQYKKWK